MIKKNGHQFTLQKIMHVVVEILNIF
jgi:hypothetical protein